jgi:2Fe-2S ferredoxin
MPQVTFVLPDRQRRTVDAPAGSSVMQAAIANDVKGIDAECGGCLSCATCHVYVDPAWFVKMPPAHDDEIDMLGFVAAEQRPNSRLACQIMVGAELDGLVVQVPERQVG